MQILDTEITVVQRTADDGGWVCGERNFESQLIRGRHGCSIGSCAVERSGIYPARLVCVRLRRDSIGNVLGKTHWAKPGGYHREEAGAEDPLFLFDVSFSSREALLTDLLGTPNQHANNIGWTTTSHDASSCSGRLTMRRRRRSRHTPVHGKRKVRTDRGTEPEKEREKEIGTNLT